MAELDFTATQTSSKLITIYDTSEQGQYLPETISAWTLTIRSSKIPATVVIDILAYLASSRESDEVYKITSASLGLGSNEDIPDGLYYMDYNINNVLRKENTFLAYYTVQQEVIALLESVNLGISVDEFGSNFEGDFDQYPLQDILVINALYSELDILVLSADEVKINDTLDKLQRLLGIVTT